MTSMSDEPVAISLPQPLVDDLAAAREADRLDDLVVVGKLRHILIPVPERAEEIVQIAREQRRGIGREAAREIGRADDRHAVLLDALAGNRALDIAARVGGKIDDDAARAHRRDLRVADQRGAGFPGSARW
jgi:hypothetical protein